jgi:hypothetical protein
MPPSANDAPIIFEHTREAWLKKLVEVFRPYFARIGYPLPNQIYISVGPLPPRSIGICYSSAQSDDGGLHIFVSAVVSNPIRVAGIVAHELCHAALDCEGGHGYQFRRLATSIGLVGKMTATVEGPRFIELIESGVLPQIGPYPHAALRRSTRTKSQKTRMLAVRCTNCGYVLRASRSVLELGIPECPNTRCAEFRNRPMSVEWRNRPHDDEQPRRPGFES